MKTLRKMGLAALVLLVLQGSTIAEDKPQSPPAPAPAPIKTMIDYKAELGMSDEQVNQVKETLLSFQKTVKEQRELLISSEKDYTELVKAQAPLPDIKSKLRTIADARFNLRYADVLTSRRVNDILSAEQMTKWRAIQAEVRAKAAPKK